MKQFFATAATDSAAFQRWFGDSKVVNPDGTPMVVYHGTANEMWTSGKRNSFNRANGMGEGAYFATDRAMAQKYADMDAEVDEGTPMVIEAYLSVQNPYRTNDHMVYQSISPEFKAELVSQGYDGVFGIYPDGTVGEIAVFEPTQIKSVYNSGTFDPTEVERDRKPTYPVSLAIAEECVGTFKHLRRKWLGDNEDEAMRQAMEHALEGWEAPERRAFDRRVAMWKAEEAATVPCPRKDELRAFLHAAEILAEDFAPSSMPGPGTTTNQKLSGKALADFVEQCRQEDFPEARSIPDAGTK